MIMMGRLEENIKTRKGEAGFSPAGGSGKFAVRLRQAGGGTGLGLGSRGWDGELGISPVLGKGNLVRRYVREEEEKVKKYDKHRAARSLDAAT
jgi:hypothetical protein